MTEKYSTKAVRALKSYLEKLPERLDITREDIIKIVGVDEEKYGNIMNSNSWEIQTRDRIGRILGIHLMLGGLSGVGLSEDYLKNERIHFKRKVKKLQNRSILEMLMDGSEESLFQAQDYVTELCIPPFS